MVATHLSSGTVRSAKSPMPKMVVWKPVFPRIRLGSVIETVIILANLPGPEQVPFAMIFSEPPKPYHLH
jgi:hypothetical protein